MLQLKLERGQDLPTIDKAKQLAEGLLEIPAVVAEVTAEFKKTEGFILTSPIPKKCFQVRRDSEALAEVKNMFSFCWQYPFLRESFRDLLTHGSFEYLALQETWTDKDTAMLQRSAAPGWVKEMTTDEILKRLPNLKHMPWMTPSESQDRAIAIVGSGAGLLGAGRDADIDAHEHVVRFNNFSIDSNGHDFGKKTTIHVVNGLVRACCHALVPVFDLEVLHYYSKSWWFPDPELWDRRLRRLYTRGHIQNPLFFLRPTILSKPIMRHVTRGFLFYVVCGQYFRKSAFYGFTGRATVDNHVERESLLEIEHAVYRGLRNAGAVELK